MAKPRDIAFSEWTIEEAKTAITDAIDALVGTEAFDINKAYLEDQDHYQDGDRWVGPTGGSNTAAQSAAKAGIERQFTPVHVIGEVLETAANALLQHDAEVTFVRRDGQQPGAGTDPASPAAAQAQVTAAATEAETLAQWRQRIGSWATERRLYQQAREAVRRSRWAARGALRAWVPPATIDNVKAEGSVTRVIPAVPSPEEALKLVQVMAPAPESVHVYEHPDTHQRCGIYLYKTPEGDDAAELWYAEGEGDARQTVVRQLGVGEGTPMPLALGGRLPIAEMQAELLITEPVRKQQAALDFFESLKVRVAESAGFPERYTLNAAPSGIWVKEAPTSTPVLDQYADPAGVTWYLVGAQRTLGSSITTELRGLPVDRPDGTKDYAAPGVAFKEPTDPEYVLKLCAHQRQTILRECKQGHVDTAEQTETSGVARVQARWGFIADANNQKGALEQLLAEVIEAALAIAGLANSETAQFLANWRVEVRVHVDAGPLSADEIDAILTRVDKGALTLESALALMGVEDVAGELQRLKERPEAVLALRAKQAEVLGALIGAGLSETVAIKLVGFTPAEVAMIEADLEATASEADAEEQRRMALQDGGDGNDGGTSGPSTPGEPSGRTVDAGGANDAGGRGQPQVIAA